LAARAFVRAGARSSSRWATRSSASIVTATSCAGCAKCSRKSRRPPVIALEEVPRDEVRHYGIARPQRTQGSLVELADLVEKPSPADAPSTLAIAARYVLSPAIFQALDATQPGVGGEIQLTDAIRRLIRDGGRAYGVVLGPDERRFDIGNFDAYFRAFVEFALADPKHGPALRAFVERLVR
jgi:UTP--glucose-1-phosphate uridylyltransferase